jgi:signal transduction histidine kinase
LFLEWLLRIFSRKGIASLARRVPQYQRIILMNPTASNDLTQLALLAELARPLAHECNNFLNNLLLQLAITDKFLPDPTRADWANVRREAKKLAHLFQQWQRQRKHDAGDLDRVELNQLIQEGAESIHSELAGAQIQVCTAGEPLWLMGSAGEMQRLMSLLLHYAVAAIQSGGIDSPTLEVHLANDRDRILVQMRSSEVPDLNSRWSDFDERASFERHTLSLAALACKSLAEHFGGTIRIERNAEDGTSLVVDLPRARPDDR